MRAHQRLRLEDNRGFAHGRAQPIEPDEDQAICSTQPGPRWRGPLQDDKLLAEKCELSPIFGDGLKDQAAAWA